MQINQLGHNFYVIHCIYTHTHIHTYIRTYIRTYIHTYIRTYVHTYVHTYIHTYLPYMRNIWRWLLFGGLAVLTKIVKLKSPPTSLLTNCMGWFAKLNVSQMFHAYSTYIHTYVHTYIHYIHTYIMYIHTYIHIIMFIIQYTNLTCVCSYIIMMINNLLCIIQWWQIERDRRQICFICQKFSSEFEEKAEVCNVFLKMLLHKCTLHFIGIWSSHL